MNFPPQRQHYLLSLPIVGDHFLKFQNGSLKRPSVAFVVLVSWSQAGHLALESPKLCDGFYDKSNACSWSNARQNAPFHVRTHLGWGSGATLGHTENLVKLFM